MQDRYRFAEASGSDRKIFLDDDHSINEIASFDGYEYISNSFSAAKETDSVENSANKENIMHPNSWMRKSFLSDISEKEENSSNIYEHSSKNYKKEINLSKFTPDKSMSKDRGSKMRKSANSNSSLENSDNKINESGEEVVVSIIYTNSKPQWDKTEHSSKHKTQSKHSALIEALTRNMDSYEDALMLNLNPGSEDKEGFEILEINNTDNSPQGRSESNIHRTPVKWSQSDHKTLKLKEFELYVDDLEEKVNQEPRRRSRKKEGDSSHINIQEQDKSSMQSLDVSDVPDHDHDMDENSCKNGNDSTINISPPHIRDWDKGSDYDRTSKELGIDHHSPDEEYEINEKDLDENYNTNIYSDEGFEELEKQCQIESNLPPIKDYYLKQSQYLSGITEQSIEESIMTKSLDNRVSRDAAGSQMKHLLISKYSCSDDGIKKDSVAFLYDRLRDQLEKDTDNSADNIDEYQITLSPFDLIEGNVNR